MSSHDYLAKAIREIPDYPKEGILFYDITTLINDGKLFREVADIFHQRYVGKGIDKVVGIEARGFLFAPMLAYSLNAGLVPVRKPGKLPAEMVEISYDLEYGTDSVQMHKDALKPGEKVLLVDDLLATGGTAAATCKLIEQQGAIIAGVAFVIELDGLNGRQKLPGQDIFSILHYEY